MQESFLFNNNGSRKIIVSFGGKARSFGGITPFEFKGTFERILPDWDQLFLVDHHGTWYHHGVKDETKDIESTVEFLRSRIESYDEVVFLGNSAGGYASILFGSILNVDRVVSITPQTILDFEECTPYVGEYRDVIPHLNDCTEYNLVGVTHITDRNDYHHRRQCDRVFELEFNNVDVKYFERFSLITLRERGELDDFILSHIN